MPLTRCSLKKTNWWDCISQHCNVIHSLLVIWKKNDVTGFHKLCNVTHLLLVTGKDVMRLPFTKYAMLLTRCWSQVKMWDCPSKNRQCHSLPVGHMKRCDETIALHKISNVTHFLLVIERETMKLPFTKCTMTSQTIGHRKGCDETAVTINTLYSADAPIPRMFSSLLVLWRYFTYAWLIRTPSFHLSYHSCVILCQPLFLPCHCSTYIRYLVPLFQIRLILIH